MNLEDLIDENGLQQDEWSLSRPTFGETGQLEVVGWSGKRKYNKIYIVKCQVCSQDSELFGQGHFKTMKGSLVGGQVPCGCAKNPRWSIQQYETRCSRKAKELGYTFLGFDGVWCGKKTKVTMFCERHGKWSSGIIDDLVNTGCGCPKCADEKCGKLKTKNDQTMIKSFFASGAFHPDTKFWRSDRLNAQFAKVYWYSYCPVCSTQGESMSSDLQTGHRSCACSPMRQLECYINLVVDENRTPVAIKFGIANNSKERIKRQNRLSSYSVDNYLIFTFGRIEDCRKAERECKQELECAVLTKEEMPDGFTETTYVYNLEKILEIYERNGGTRQENP